MIDLFSKIPLSEQLAELIRKDYIIPGTNGDRLPAFAKISKKYDVGLGATQEAFRKLQKEGAILSRSGVGSFIHKTDTAKEKIRIAFPNEAPLSVICEDIIKMFIEDSPGCDVELVPVEAIRYAQFINDSNKDVDVAIIRESDFMGIDSGSLVHLSKQSLSKYDIWEECWDLFSRLKRIYATPILFSPSTLLYNPEKFKKAGIKTPSADCNAAEFEEIAKNLSENDGLFCLTFNPNRWLCMLLGEGVPLNNINGRPIPDFTHPSFNEALRKVAKAFRNNALLQQEGTIAKCICNGSVDMMLGSI
jgi:DNA-binding transcriptional regulator YhcF (GntR family)